VEEQRSKKPIAAVVIGGFLALIVLLVGAFLGGALFGYELGMRDHPAPGNSDANWPPKDTNSRYAGEWRGDVEGKLSGSVELNLIENGKFSGNDGCNTGNGSWSFDGSELHFEGIVATKIYCDNVKTYLFDATGARLTENGSELTLLSKSGESIGTLHRHAPIRR